MFLNLVNISKKINHKFILKKVNLQLYKNSILSIFGSNGSGKSTLLNIISGTVLPTSGKIEYFGKALNNANKDAILKNVSIASTYNSLYKNLTVQQNLEIYLRLYIQKYDQKIHSKLLSILKFFEIENLINLKFTDLSSGQKNKINIIKSFLIKPKIILLDEPDSAFDIDTIDKLKKKILEEKKRGASFILTTPKHNSCILDIVDTKFVLDSGNLICS